MNLNKMKPLATKWHWMQALILCAVVLWWAGCQVKSQQLSGGQSVIHVNQLGFVTGARKQAVVVGASETDFQLQDMSGRTVLEGKLLPSKYWDKADEYAAIADFSSVTTPGKYRVQCGELTSFPFEISDQLYTDLIRASAKSYYFNRVSTALDKEFAGAFERDFSHPDTQVYVHASAASMLRPVGTVISTPYGWYDAGDYNKYVVNSGITMYTLLLAYEHSTDLFDTLTWNIPESNNQRADLLDEIWWNLRWMENMQDPADGGVYHKTTTAAFEDFIFPTKAQNKRYVVAKGTAAALNYAAVLAKATTIPALLDAQTAEQYLKKAENAWKWALANPHVKYRNPATHEPDSPPISTGEYGDHDFRDEFFWAAAELYAATGNQTYLSHANMATMETFRIPNWSTVETLGLITLASAGDLDDGKLKKEAADRLKMLAENLTKTWAASPYKVTLEDFRWGSNSTILNEGLVLMNAYRFFHNKEFFDAALAAMDYVLGRNATGYCFVTGFGSRSPQNIHHRQSASDDVDAPIPGFLVGGPNPRNVQQDCGKSAYSSHLPAKCYIDALCSYSTNEVAINWNAPLVYLSSALQSTYYAELN